ncbi:MAG TPA: hypothetical protein VIL85_12085 [Thermomicrobiales bacterium]|jgi:hypothetical protein
MMNHRLLRLCCTLLILCALFATSGLSALAKNEPTIATPRTFRYHADIALNLSGSTATGYGDGEFDLARQAFHLTVVAEEDGMQIRQELILVNNRLYIYSEERQRWEYLDVPAGQAPEGLPATTLPALTVPKHPTATYERVGEETIAAATTNKWRAAGPYNVLLPILSPRTFSGVFIEDTLSVEAFIGATNNYLYRLNVDEMGTITELSDRPNPPATITSKLTYTYSDFDQPVTITAPAGAVPAQTSVTRAGLDQGTTSPLARAAQFTSASGAERIIEILRPAGLPRP